MKTFYKWLFYIVGLIILALGISLNTKTGLGSSPIISVALCTSIVWDLNFGNVTLVLYSIFVVAEFILKGKNAKLYDILQIPLSIVFTRFLNIFSYILPSESESFVINMVMLIIAIILTGVGAAMSLNMRIVPNPGDGIVQALADRFHKEVGLTKNCFDAFSIALTFVLGAVTGHFFAALGIGTVLAVIGVGRAVAIFNKLFKKKMDKLVGVVQPD